MQRIRWYGPSIVLLITVLAVMVAGPGIVRQLAYAETSARVQLIKNELVESPSLQTLSDAFTKVAEVVEPSVVHIQILSSRAPQSRFGQMPDRADEFFERFFGEDGRPRRSIPRPQQDDREDYNQYNPKKPVGNGSGWVYDTEGHIITNNHVVKGAESITVKFRDGAEYDATVVGRDEKTDIAVLKVNAKNLHAATLATQEVRQGEIVFAFGSPFRFDFSMTQGIVSAKGRQDLGIIGEQGAYEDFIQTDAAINPGNSGGPLTNIYGQVIGMNTAIATKTGAFNGLGFAIPVDMVKNIAAQLIDSGSVSRGYLGIQLPPDELDENMAKSFGFEGTGGVLVESVQPADGPAGKAGLKRGDIITKINNIDIRSIPQLRRVIAAFPANTTINVTYFRDGDMQKTDVTLAEFPKDALAQAPNQEIDEETPEVSEGADTLRKLGLAGLQTFTDQIAEREDVTFTPGVLIKSVRPGSVAALEGLRPPMLITHVQGAAVTNVTELTEEIAKYNPENGIRITISIWDPRQKKYSQLFRFLELPEADG
ncbi:trypsin-like peptidase domain-containing protein [Poriferisphaera sp. WC338]|uniref:trypsin-like peptidase domain-containing protein n=1 Tax=Poriferisphaera sp. WC338 TaxID=3425129 RepID=UPI003D8160A4